METTVTASTDLSQLIGPELWITRTVRASGNGGISKTVTDRGCFADLSHGPNGEAADGILLNSTSGEPTGFHLPYGSVVETVDHVGPADDVDAGDHLFDD